MKITYDKEADALYIYLNKDVVHKTEELRPDIVIDYAKDGSTIGFEVLSISKKMSKKALESFNVEVSLGKSVQ